MLRGNKNKNQSRPVKNILLSAAQVLAWGGISSQQLLGLCTSLESCLSCSLLKCGQLGMCLSAMEIGATDGGVWRGLLLAE